MEWYYIDTGENTGGFNMAFDNHMLLNPPDKPLLRMFSWNPSAVSLGFNQRLKSVNRKILALNNIDLVRRSTGGRAVLHKNEVTYSVVIPKDHEYFNYGIHQLYRILSEAIVDGFQRLGIQTDIEKNKAGIVQDDLKELCFSSTARFEIKLNDEKLVGSAQRRLTMGVLQHGSILYEKNQELLEYLLNDNEQNIELFDKKNKSLQKNFGTDIEKDHIKQYIKIGFENKLNANFTDYKLADHELLDIEQSIKQFYVN